MQRGRWGPGEIGIQRYSGDATITIDVGVCVTKSAVKKGEQQRMATWVEGSG